MNKNNANSKICLQHQGETLITIPLSYLTMLPRATWIHQLEPGQTQVEIEPDISETAAQVILGYVKKHRGQPPNKSPTIPLSSCNPLHWGSKWDVEMLAALARDKMLLFEVAEWAHQWGVDPLRDLVCAFIATQLKACSAEQAALFLSKKNKPKKKN